MVDKPLLLPVGEVGVEEVSALSEEGLEFAFGKGPGGVEVDAAEVVGAGGGRVAEEGAEVAGEDGVEHLLALEDELELKLGEGAVICYMTLT